MHIYWNKNYLDIKEKSDYQFFDRAFHFGDGIYETIAIKNFKAVFLNEHLDRLFYDARQIDLPVKYSKDDISDNIGKIIELDNIAEGFAKIIISRGTMMDAGLSYPEPINPSVLLWGQHCKFMPFKDKRSFKLVISQHERRNQHSIVTFVKTLNYLTNIIAKREADEKGCDEAILLNIKDHVCECTTSNIFIIGKDDSISTPHVDSGLLSGVIRNKIILTALEVGLNVYERPISLADLENAKGCFLTSSLIGVTPVKEILDIAKYDVGKSFELMELLDSKYETLVTK